MNNPTMLGYKKTGFVLPFVTGAGGRMATLEEILANTTLPMVSSGITKRVVPNRAKMCGLDYYYIDTGYFGNHDRKVYFRVTKNGHQNTGPVKTRPDDRLGRLRIDRTWYPRGKKILLVPPDIKVCTYYQLPNPEQWIQDTVTLIKSHTDRPVEIRSRPASRRERVTADRFVDALQNDVNAVVAYSSNCAVESVMHGIPVAVLGESAAWPLSGQIKNIDALSNLDVTEVDAWMRHLSYCQFTQAEMLNGLAYRIVSGK